MALSKKLSLLRRKSISRTISDQEMKFYPISVDMLFRLKQTITPIAKAIAVLTQSKRQDATRTFEEGVEPTTGLPVKVEHYGNADVETLKLRYTQSQQAIQDALDTLLSPESRELLGRVLADSLRDEEGLGPNAKDEAIAEFMASLDLPLLTEFLGGLIEANAGVFGPLAGRAKAMAEAKLAEVMAQTQANATPAGVEASAGGQPVEAAPLPIN